MLKIKGPATLVLETGQSFDVEVDIALPNGRGTIVSDQILRIAHTGGTGTLRWGNMKIQAIVTEGRGDGTGKIVTSGRPTPV